MNFAFKLDEYLGETSVRIFLSRPPGPTIDDTITEMVRYWVTSGRGPVEGPSLLSDVIRDMYPKLLHPNPHPRRVLWRPNYLGDFI